MTTIRRYVCYGDSFILAPPEDAVFLSAHVDDGHLNLFFEMDIRKYTKSREFVLVQEGFDVDQYVGPANHRKYLCTVIDHGGHPYMLYEKLR